jgi:PAS domain S-box-containing protein
LLIALGDRLRDLDDTDEIKAVAAAMLGSALRAARCGFGENDQATAFATVTKDWTDGSMPSATGRHRLDAFGADRLAEFEAGRTLRIDDAHRDGRVGARGAAAYAAIGGVRASLAVPTRKAGKWVATLFVHDTAPRAWTDEDEELVREVAERTWSAVEKARAQAAVQESEARFRNMADNAPVMIWTTDPTGYCTYLNARWHRFTGQTEQEARGFGWLDATHPDDRAEAERIFLEANAKAEAFRLEYRLRRADGVYRWAIDAAAPRFGPHGAFMGFIGSVIDISERKEAEARIAEKNAELETILDAMPAAVWIANDPESREISGNRASCELLRLPPGANASKTAADPAARPAHFRVLDRKGSEIPPHDLPVQRAARGEDVRGFEEQLVFSDGSPPVHLMGNAVPLRDARGRPRGAVAAFVDITALKQAEEQRTLLIDELNHRVKNTLATVQSIASQTLRGAGVDAEVRQAFEARLFALARAHDVLTQQSWEGASLREIMDKALAPFRIKEGRSRIEGPDVRLPPKATLAVAMALHELATNAVKYGALSNAVGQVSVAWAIAGRNGDGHLALQWEERGGPGVAAPARKGFGSRLIERGLAGELGGEAVLDYRPTGLVCSIAASLLNGPREGRAEPAESPAPGDAP